MVERIDEIANNIAEHLIFDREINYDPRAGIAVQRPFIDEAAQSLGYKSLMDDPHRYAHVVEVTGQKMHDKWLVSPYLT